MGRKRIALCIPLGFAVGFLAPAHAKSEIACRDDEVADLALALAVGPMADNDTVQLPSCVPAPRQGLWAFTDDASEVGTHDRGGSPVVETVSFSHAVGTSDAHLAHLHVVQSNARWCPWPCDGPTWELATAKPALTSSYTLLEAAIWRQDRRVALYQFDPAWEQDARQAYHKVCNHAWKCTAYEIFREKRKLLEVGPWPLSADKDPEELSKFLLGAFQAIFAKFRDVAPGARHVAVTYSGHGARADGSLFEGAVLPKDAVALLGGLPAVGGPGKPPVSFMNFGGNCAEGRWNMLATLYPFADWIIASDLNVGGVHFSKNELSSSTGKAKMELGAMSIIKRAAEANTPVRETLEQVVAARKKIWDTAWKAPILRQDLEQSIAVYRTDAFKPFRAAIRAQFERLTSADQAKFKEYVETRDCDVLAAASFLDNQTLRTSFLKGSADKNLVAKFHTLRPLYASTRHLVK